MEFKLDVFRKAGDEHVLIRVLVFPSIYSILKNTHSHNTRVVQTHTQKEKEKERERLEMSRRDDDYSFLQIADAKGSLNQRVNLIGVVVDTSIPKQSRGTDCFCTVKIVDESSSDPGIPVNFFAESMEKLPRVESAGDIIQLSRVMMKIHGGEVYALFNKKFSAFALFEGNESATYVPYRASMNFRSRDQDKKIIEGLRKWSACKQLDGMKQAVPLKEIKSGVRLNVMCKVLHVCGVGDDSWIAFVWDGTDTPPLAIQNSLGAEMVKPLPLQLESFTLSRDVLCTFPAVGTVLRVFIDQGNDKFDLKYLRTGRWMVLVNIIFECEASGLWNGRLMPSTRLRFLSDDDPHIIRLQRDYDERYFSKWGRMPLSSFPYCSHITETDHEDIPFASLMNILIHTEVTAKFRCVVRVVAIYPWRAEDFRSPKGTFRLRLTLEDPTARIHAYVYAEDGVKFFDGNTSTEVLKKMRNKLLGVVANEDGDEIEGTPPRNPLWVDCCIFSYYQDENDKWGSRQFRIFDTKVVHS